MSLDYSERDLQRYLRGEIPAMGTPKTQWRIDFERRNAEEKHKPSLKLALNPIEVPKRKRGPRRATEQRHEYMREYLKKRRLTMRANGICVDCQRRPAEKTHRLCGECKKQRRDREHLRQARLAENPRRAA